MKSREGAREPYDNRRGAFVEMSESKPELVKEITGYLEMKKVVRAILEDLMKENG
jgi:hypothetical protein